MRPSKLILFLHLFLCMTFAAFSNTDRDSIGTVSKPKEIKRYIRPCIYVNSYGTPVQELKRKHFTSYGFKYSNVGLYVPVYTNTWYRKDSVTLSTLHFLVTGNSATSKATFGGLSKNIEFYKLSIGFRTIYSTGKKSVWFFDYSPFIAEDNLNYVPTWRFSSTIIYNRTVSEKFSFRIGFTKSYLFGEGLNLPVIGFRVGRLDDVHLNFQLPRNINLDFPMGQKFWGSVFAKSVGGRYNFLNPDTSFNKGIDYTIQFGRYEINTGFMLDYRPNKNISLNFGIGTVTKRVIVLADNNNPQGTGYEPFFRARLAPTLFATFGLSVRFGSARKINNNYEMYDVLDMNNLHDPGDNNAGPTNGDIPNNPARVKVSNIQYLDIQDLIDETDLN